MGKTKQRIKQFSALQEWEAKGRNEKFERFSMKIVHLCNYHDHIFQKKAALSWYEAFKCACKSGLQKNFTYKQRRQRTVK